MTDGASPRSRRNLVMALVAAVAVLALVLALGRLRSSSNAVAVLASSSGSVDRDFGRSVGAWQAAAVPAEFSVGDGVRTGKASTAKLTLADKSELGLESNTVIRFLDRPSSRKPGFDLEMGQASLSAGSEAVTFDTDVGVAVLNPGTRVSLRKSGSGTRFEVSVGMARFEPKGAPAVEVTAGHGIEIGVGMAAIEQYEIGGATAPVPTASAAEPVAPPPSAEPPAPAAGAISAHVNGSGASVRAPGETAFARLPSGDGTFAAGSTLRLASGTSADVTRGGQRATLRGAGDFVVGEADKPFIAAQGGGVSLTGAESEVAVAVPGGSIVAKLGTRAEIGVKRDATRVSVASGAVEIHTDGATERLEAGEEGTVGAKGTEVVGRGPGYVDFAATAGGSFTVHDPRPPTAIGFATGSACPEGAVVELVGRPGARARGNGTVSLLVPAGSHKYAVHCVTSAGIAKDTAATGSVAVIHDAGTARIPRTAPATLVDTDGRNYTVLYQNLLPKISVRWPSPPQASGFTLRVASPGGKSEAVPCSTASHSFASGALREGTHRLSFEGGGSRSKETQVDIKFDNAAPTATLTSPANGGFAPGAPVTVAGAALEGWKISVGGKDLALDDQLRFSGQAVAPAGQRALAIEFVNPKRGVHYYLRRGSGH